MGESLNQNAVFDTFIYENTKLLEQLEQIVLECEEKGLSGENINEIFRIMHTIKGSSAMLGEENMSTLAHAVEEIFFHLREKKPVNMDFKSLAGILLTCTDFLKSEIARMSEGEPPVNKPQQLFERLQVQLSHITGEAVREKKESVDIPEGFSMMDKICENYDLSEGNVTAYYAKLYFDEDCGMENIRAFALVNFLKDNVRIIEHVPYDLSNDDNVDIIKRKGFQLIFETNRDFNTAREYIENNTIFLRSLELNIIKQCGKEHQNESNTVQNGNTVTAVNSKSKSETNFVSVNLSKLDKLMDITSEIIITEALLVQNPDLKGMRLSNFFKVARQFRKITGELQDIVLSIRMVPITSTFQKMKRIVRDMSTKLNKQVEIQFIGEDTEVDKNIIEHISDPLMHLIRNSVDHGIEMPGDRLAKGKPENGKIVLEAKNVGNEVWIIVRDDGRGLDKDRILRKAQENGITDKSANELTDKEIYSFIFLPGFSTKEETSEFSGRGVGMDVVSKNLEKIKGSVNVDKTSGEGTVISLRIPLTLAIINGMNVKVGNAKYTIPVDSMREAIVLKKENIIIDPDGYEIVNIRGEFFPFIRLQDRFKLAKGGVRNIEQGTSIVIEGNGKAICLLVDSLIGEQQVVVKSLPSYLKKSQGIAGCALLGDGSISLILDTEGLCS